jgi:MSHA biogenesis protein MshO
MSASNRGFTLVELIVVMVITGILATGLVVFFRPAMTSYINVLNRAELTERADSAMRIMLRDVRLAVPNSFRQPLNNDTNCFESVPTSDGGRYRSAPDTTNSLSAPVDTSTTTTTFDVVSDFHSQPIAGDWIVVANQNTDDVYNNYNRAAIASITSPPLTILGKYRITLATALQFPIGYDNSRFVVVPNNQRAVYYSCVEATGVDSKGNGKGTLYRFSNYGFTARPDECPKTPDSTAHIVAKNVSSCTFTLDPNPGAIQGAGYVQLKLQLTKNYEAVDLLFGAHTENLP